MSSPATRAQPIVAVLAGGAGSRLGGAKPTASLGGKPLISYPLAVARRAGLDACVVAKLGIALPELEVELIEEADPLAHPLTGVIAALDANPGRAVIALACDLPFVPPDLLHELARAPGPAAVEAGTRLQPLIARYESSAAPAIRTALCRGDSAGDVLRGLAPHIVRGEELARFGDPRWIAFNVNTPSELADAESHLAALS